jgi:hypothetical protein
MTLPIPLVPRPAAGAGQPPAPGPVLILTRPPGLALAVLSDPGRPPGPPDDRSRLWLRNAAAGLGVLAAAAAMVSFTAFGGLRYQKCLNASEGRVGRGLAEAWLVGCGG